MPTIYTMTGAEITKMLQNFDYTLDDIAVLSCRSRCTVANASRGRRVMEDTAVALREGYRKAVEAQRKRLAEMESFLGEANRA